MSKDKNGKDIKVGDVVGMLFDVLEATDVSPGVNLKLRAKHVPTGEHVIHCHVNSGAVQLIDSDDAETTTEPKTAA